MEETLFMDGVRSLFAILDRMIYSLITIFYNTISDLAAAQLVKTSVINDIAGRIYALLGIFMLFRLSFSLINYIIDPDQIADKTKGGGTLIKNIVITFALIVSTPFCFDLLYEAQSALLADQVLPRFILGIDITETGSDKGGYKLQMTGCGEAIEIPNMGNYLGLAIFKPFFVPYEDGEPDDEAMGIYCLAHDDETKSEASVKNLLATDVRTAPNSTMNTKRYTFDYSFLLSTAIGVVVALILLGYCFDIATRSIKLLFLEVIAPIPVISYIDPNSSKSGMFIKWLKEVGGTWISLFTRLASFYLAVFVIQQITAIDGALYFVTGYNFEGSVAWIKILIIIGALIFAKQLPKILENILGFQLGGNMTLNPIKKFENEALGGSTIRKVGTAAVAGAVGATGGFVAGLKAGSEVGDPIRGAIRGTLNGFGNGRKDPCHALSSGMSNTYKNMTGNDIFNMTPLRYVASRGGAAKVNEVKGHIKVAKNRLNEKNTRLNEITYTTPRIAERLKSKGINMNNLPTEKSRFQSNLSELKNKTGELKSRASSAKSNLEAAQNALNSAIAERDKAQKFIDNYKASAVFDDGSPIYSTEYRNAQQAVQDYSSQISNLETKRNDANTAYETNNRELKQNEDMIIESEQNIKDIDSYLSSRTQEEQLRSEISKIEREISTLSDEKKQRERYYQVDTSPKDSVSEAFKNNPIL